jgi:regulator of sigma E protease
MALIPFLLLFSLLVFVHEGGHFLMAKLFGVGVPEFGFGYPPRIWGKKIGKTLYSINLIPFGGFARIKGAEGESEGLGDADSFAVKSKSKRALILCGGIIGNFLLAWVLFTFLFVIGNPAPANKVFVDEVVAGSPAADAGIEAGDYILSFNEEPVESSGELVALIDESVGQTTSLVIERGDETRSLTAMPRVGSSGEGGELGFLVSTGVAYNQAAVWKAPFIALGEVVNDGVQMVRIAFGLIGGLIKGEEVQVGGPVAILALTETYINYGIRIFIQFVALLSLNLVIVNLFPFPALDGGRLLFIAYEAVRGKRPSQRAERLVNSLGFALLIILMILITIKDIQTFF